MSLSNRSLHFSSSFCISCGTVTIDPHRSKVLVVYFTTTNEYFLPKGRKNIAETFEQAALRETYEETGVFGQLLPVTIPTLATLSSEDEAETRKTITEPIAVTQRTTNGVLKIIYWFVATADSTLPPQAGAREAHEQFSTVWISIPDELSLLSFDDDRQIITKATDAALARPNATEDV